MNPIADLARVIPRGGGALVIVDAVSSRAARRSNRRLGDRHLPRRTQKRSAVPPGLTVSTLSDRAAERAKTVPHRGFYTDLLRYVDKHKEGGFITTPRHPAALGARRATRPHPRRGDGGALGPPSAAAG